jgi:NodT family efflux transporter outer membrane factor (OMF) lipoprotein
MDRQGQPVPNRYNQPPPDRHNQPVPYRHNQPPPDRHGRPPFDRHGQPCAGHLRTAAALCVSIILTGCMVGPDYKRPDPPATPVAFKELAGWKISQPADAADKGAWWSVYHDPELDRLEREVDVSNQTVKQFEAQYRNAVALVAGARAGLFPTVGLNAGVTRSGTGASGGSNRNSSVSSASSFGGTSRSGTEYNVSGTVAWDLDVWGRIRRQIESSNAAAQVSAADLANAKLSAQATLATDYFDLRAEDALAKLLTETTVAFRRALRITENQYRAGTSSSIDYVTALAQLQSTEAQLVAVGVQRQQFEHAIAALTGHAPADLTIAPAPLAAEVPVLPPGLPSALLERRPDIAGAERAMQQQNALIGAQIAAYYPDISLSALGEYAGFPLAQLFNVSNQFWSLGATGAETLFNGGLRAADVAAARATYDASVAAYRQTVLTAFQQVEDALSDLRILEQQAKAEAIAVNSTRRAVDATLNAYRAGTVAYTSVITEQTLLLSDQQTALAVQQSRLVASVALIEALGGGWSATDLPARVETANPLLP